MLYNSARTVLWPKHFSRGLHMHDVSFTTVYSLLSPQHFFLLIFYALSTTPSFPPPSHPSFSSFTSTSSFSSLSTLCSILVSTIIIPLHKLSCLKISNFPFSLLFFFYISPVPLFSCDIIPLPPLPQGPQPTNPPLFQFSLNALSFFSSAKLLGFLSSQFPSDH